MKNLGRILLSTMIGATLVMSTPVFASVTDTGTLKTTVGDSVITTKIKGQFVANNTTKATSINVETNNGIVKLTGTVDSDAEATTAIEIAASTDGVKEVNTQGFYVKDEQETKEQPVRDSFITAKVKGMLIREKLMNNMEFPAISISVETKNRIVHLDGKVANKDQLKKAVELTKSVDGVEKVVSKLTVSAA